MIMQFSLRKASPTFLVTTASILFAASALPWSVFLLLPAFALLMELERKYHPASQGNKAFLYLFISLFIPLLIWNGSRHLWLLQAQPLTALSIIGVNALFMTLPFLFFHFTKAKSGNKFGQISLLIFWVAFEYVHQAWFLRWPLPSLGFELGAYPALVGFYSLTGHTGGTVWVLLIAFLLRDVVFEQANRLVLPLALLLPVLALPFAPEPEQQMGTPYEPNAGILPEGAFYEQLAPRPLAIPKGYFFERLIGLPYSDSVQQFVVSYQGGEGLLLGVYDLLLPSEVAKQAAKRDFVVIRSAEALPQPFVHTLKAFAISVHRSVLVVLPFEVKAFNAKGMPMDALKPANFHDDLTLFAKNGNYLGRLAAFLAVFMYLAAFVKGKVTEQA